MLGAVPTRASRSADLPEPGSFDQDLGYGACRLYFRGRSRFGTSATWWCRDRRSSAAIDAAMVQAFEATFGSLRREAFELQRLPGSGANRVGLPYDARVTWDHGASGWTRFTIFQPGANREVDLLRRAGFAVEL